MYREMTGKYSEQGPVFKCLNGLYKESASPCPRSALEVLLGHDGDPERRDDEGEQLPLDLDFIHDHEYRAGHGPKLYAVFNGEVPGLYDKYVCYWNSVR